MMQSTDPLKHVKLLSCSSCIPKQAVFDAAADAVIETMTRKVQEGIKLSVLLSTKKSLKTRFLDLFRKAPKVADDAAEAAARQLDDQVTNGLRIVGLVNPNEIVAGAAAGAVEKGGKGLAKQASEATEKARNSADDVKASAAMKINADDLKTMSKDAMEMTSDEFTKKWSRVMKTVDANGNLAMDLVDGKYIPTGVAYTVPDTKIKPLVSDMTATYTGGMKAAGDITPATIAQARKQIAKAAREGVAQLDTAASLFGKKSIFKKAGRNAFAQNPGRNMMRLTSSFLTLTGFAAAASLMVCAFSGHNGWPCCAQGPFCNKDHERSGACVLTSGQVESEEACTSMAEWLGGEGSVYTVPDGYDPDKDPGASVETGSFTNAPENWAKMSEIERKKWASDSSNNPNGRPVCTVYGGIMDKQGCENARFSEWKPLTVDDDKGDSSEYVGKCEVTGHAVASQEYCDKLAKSMGGPATTLSADWNDAMERCTISGFTDCTAYGLTEAGSCNRETIQEVLKATPGYQDVTTDSAAVKNVYNACCKSANVPRATNKERCEALGARGTYDGSKTFPPTCMALPGGCDGAFDDRPNTKAAMITMYVVLGLLIGVPIVILIVSFLKKARIAKLKGGECANVMRNPFRDGYDGARFPIANQEAMSAFTNLGPTAYTKKGWEEAMYCAGKGLFAGGIGSSKSSS